MGKRWISIYKIRMGRLDRKLINSFAKKYLMFINSYTLFYPKKILNLRHQNDKTLSIQHPYNI